ncbi:KICSTOR complex protein SZT2-like [Anthonomus grandis grandis]|uniref:KICSTOR complex protein SZT2-like n=1 Tax=Anthonomus grandis grandis TaxID=2921223 RepID=UPI00216644A3|nr:KICSTOR complex protein SZT2-like [Anthonomus grandis grandis]
MEFDCSSLCSDEGVELPEHGFQTRQDFLFGDDQPDFVEAKTIYLLLPKGVPISRAARLQWLLDHLDTIITISTNKSFENSQKLEVISALPREQNLNVKCTRFFVTYRTELKFIAHAYKFVYCLDMSPSHANIDIESKEVLFDQILNSFKISIEGLSKQFTIPGNTLVFQPCIYLTIVANTPFFITPAQQVILKGIQMTPWNVNEIIKGVEAHFHLLEGKIADACMQALDKIDSYRVCNDDSLNDPSSEISDISRLSKIPMVTPDANFVNMLRYSMLAICLLPETTLSHILVITDGIVSMPDSNVMETMLHQLHYDAIAVSFLKVGSSFHPHCGAGLVSYIDLLYFFAHSTLGTCLESFPKIVPDSSLSMNFYQESFLVWSFHNGHGRMSFKPCDNSISWNSTDDRFYNQRLPTLLTKRQTDESASCSILILLARRMREGFIVDNLFYMNGTLEIKLLHQWKSSIYIHYKLTSQWPIEKNLTQFEVCVCAPYEFLHDMTCLIKKETKSVFRQAIIQRFWSRLSQISSGDLMLASQFSNFTDGKEWWTLPDSVKNGFPVFSSNNPTYSDSTKFILVPRDNYCQRFINIWQGVSQMETNHWRKWFHMHKISLILTHDTPLPTNLYMSSCSSQRYQVVQCRQAVVALYEMLAEWASFVLIDNHTYLKLIYTNLEKPPIGFCIVRVSSKFPSAVLNLGFSTNIPGQVRYAICDDLKASLSSLSYPPKANESSCCVLLQKPLEKILIRYERVPSTYTTVVFPDGTQPPDSSSGFSSSVCGSLFTTLSRYLFHKRWIWSASFPPNPRLPDASISRILNILTRMRLKEGYHFAYSSSGIVTMVLEVPLEPQASCVVQYVLFPPCYSWGDDSLSGSEEEPEPVADMEAELQMITEVWIEPHYGSVVPSNSRISYFNGLTYYQIADAISKIDFRCINVLLTMEHISLLCQNKTAHNLNGERDVDTPRPSFSKQRSYSRKNSRLTPSRHQNAQVPENGSPWYPIVTPRIEHIPFKFDPIGLLHLCQQTEMLFSMLREEKSNNHKKPQKVDRANKLLLDNIFEHFSLLHDREIELSNEESECFTKEIITRHKNKEPHSCPIDEKQLNDDCSYRWKCYVKGVSITHVILTFLPASVEDLKALVGVESSNLDESDERAASRGSNISDVPINTPNMLCLPLYVFDCPLKRLVSAYVDKENNSSYFLEDVYLDHRFKYTDSIVETKEKLRGSDTESCLEGIDSPDLRNVREHCTALEMTHTKCFALSLFLALHMGIYIHNYDVQNAMDLCDEEISEIDITDYILKTCSHARVSDEDQLSIQALNEAYPCNDLKKWHMLIKNKFFKTVCSSFNKIPSNGEYYYFKHLSIQPEDKSHDSDDEASIASEIEFISERDMSIYSEGPHLLTKTLNSGNIDVASMSDVSPLFLHFVCTLRYNNSEQTNTSLRVLPTCLGELIQSLEKPTAFLIKSRIQVTFDIFCLTLPSRIQNVLNDYSQQGLRTTSFCSDGGFQRTISNTSDLSGISEITLPLKSLTELQKQSVSTLCSEIKWLLEDEICTSLLDVDPITTDTLGYVIDHVISGDQARRASCKLSPIALSFVYTTEQSYTKFLEEFQRLNLPIGYQLCKEQEYYYVAKETEEFSRENDTLYNNLSFTARSSSVTEFAVSASGSNSSLLVGSVKDIMSQQSDSSEEGSVTGTDGGYDEDVSEDDDDNCQWLENLSNKRKQLPNFWLILKVDQDFVYVYFHCRFVELSTPQVEIYSDIERAVCDSIVDLCKKVNQLLLLQSLYESKTCDPLLEADDSSHSENSILSNNSSLGRARFDPDNSDDSDIMQFSRSMSDASLSLKAGYFSCPVVWEKEFVLHPRLKTGGTGSKSGASRGIQALRNILEKFSVVNRQNMFVCKDKEDNVFYLRLCESVNLHISGSRISIKPDNESNTFSRSPSISSLPAGQNSKPNLASSNQSIASLVSSDIVRPRVRSFGEKETRQFDSKDSRERINEDTLILRVHGVAQAGSYVQCELVHVLQNKLDDAVLEFLSLAMVRNPLCPLTPEDVRFIQKPQEADYVIRLTMQDFALQWHNCYSFMHYLRQNLQPILNVPKYTDPRSENHFKDYTADQNMLAMPFENIFIYNQTASSSSGSRGIACIVLALKSSPDPISAAENEHSLENVFILKQYENSVNSRVILDEEELPESYLEFRVWKQGKINKENLAKKLTEAVSQANWDIVMEYYLLKKSLCVEEFRPTQIHTKKKIEINALKLDLEEEIEYSCEMNLNIDEYIRVKAKMSMPKKVDALYFPNRKYNKRHSVHPAALKVSKALVIHDNEQVTSTEGFEDGVLSIVYSKFLPSWLEFGGQIKASAVKKTVLKLISRHIPSIIVKELITLLGDMPKAFRALSTDAIKSRSEDIYVPFVASNVVQKYVIISRSFLKWQNTDDTPCDIPDALNPQNLKHTQKFVPIYVDGVWVPRQKMFWISIESDNIIIYTYNWAKENVEKLVKHCSNLVQWLTLRSCFLNSGISQKLGLFFNQSLTRKCFMLSTNNYYTLIANLDAMSKFPRDTQTQKKCHQPGFNLPVILETFRDNFCNTKYTSNDAVAILTIEMREMKTLEKKNRDEMKKLHSMYQSRTGSTSVSQLDLLMQNSRIIHYVHTPLLFLARWRFKSAATRDHTLYPSKAIQLADKLSNEERELWHTELCFIFFSEYRNYLHTLGFTPLQIDSSQTGIPSLWLKDKSVYNSTFYIQRTILGGILIFTVSFEEPFFVTKLYAIECSRLQNITSRASVNGFTISFLDECDKVKILMHLHSFTYDYHLRLMFNYISGNHGKLPDKYNVQQFLHDFLKYYNKAPNFARNLVHADTLTIDNLVTEGKQLFDYLLRNVNHYGFKVLEMDDSPPEFILVQVTTTRQVFYKDSQDRQHTDDFDMTLVIYNQCAPYKPTDKVLHLKYYLILTAKRDTYPMFENEQKLGKFRTVSFTSPSSGIEKSVNELEISLARSELTEESEYTESDADEISLDRCSGEKPLCKLLANVVIMQESVNYLGYYSSHEQIMQELILEKAEATQKDIIDMVSKGMVHCRTDLLWNRLISPQESTPLTYDEFIELSKLTKLIPLSQLNQSLGSLLNQSLSWYQGLAKLLVVKYAEQYRLFTSPDERTLYYVILHPKYYGAFMLLSIDLHTNRGELYGAYRETNKKGPNSLGIGYEKSLLDGFINCISFYIWSGMICG